MSANQTEILRRMLERERTARRETERILEEKSLELYHRNQELQAVNQMLEETIRLRTSEVEALALIPLENPNPVIRLSAERGVFFTNKPGEEIVAYISEQDSKYWTILAEAAHEQQRVMNFDLNVGQKVFAVTTSLPQPGGYINLYCEDVTEARMASQQYQTIATRLSTLLHHLQEAILVEDQHRKVVLANQAFCDMFEIPVSSEVLLGVDCSDSADNKKHLFADPERFARRLEELLTNREAVLEEEIRMADGRVLMRDYIPIRLDGHYLGHMWKYRDVTFKIRAEEAIRRSEEKYRGVMENMKLGLLEVDTNDHILRANSIFCTLVGYQEEEIIGKQASELFLNQDFAPRMLEQNMKRLEGQSDVYEVALLDKHQNTIWAMISGAPVYDENHAITGSIGIHLDITERKHLESRLREEQRRAEELARVREKFLANMSHEIRTPMNAILGMGRLMTRTNLNDKQFSYVSAITSSAENLLAIINDILDFSKIEQGQMSVEKIGFDFRRVIRQAVQLLSIKAEETGLDLHFHIDDRIADFLCGDPYRINQVLMNLIGNALKFTQKGSVTLRCGLLANMPGMQTLEIRIEDTGIGIDESKLANIFDSFRQADESISRKFGGTGLGLAISKQLVELMGGTIRVDSRKGIGTTFTLYLPLEIAAGDERFRHDEVLEALPCSLKGCHLLLAEDNEFNRMLAITLLEQWGATVDPAENGQEAVDKARVNRYDLVLMDIQMPEMDGITATRIMRQEMELTTPIVALTANVTPEEHRRYLDAGMDDTLIKPFDEAALHDTILRLLKRSVPAATEAPPTATAQEEALYDLTKLRNLARGNDAFIQKMIGIFTEQVGAQVEDIRQAMAANNLEGIRAVVHKVRPIADNLGITSLREPLLDVHKACHEGNPGNQFPVMVKTICQTLLDTAQQLREREMQQPQKT